MATERGGVGWTVDGHRNIADCQDLSLIFGFSLIFNQGGASHNHSPRPWAAISERACMAISSIEIRLGRAKQLLTERPAILGVCVCRVVHGGVVCDVCGVESGDWCGGLGVGSLSLSLCRCTTRFTKTIRNSAAHVL